MSESEIAKLQARIEYLEKVEWKKVSYCEGSTLFGVGKRNH